jgi:hypothetical protein
VSHGRSIVSRAAVMIPPGSSAKSQHQRADCDELVHCGNPRGSDGSSEGVGVVTDGDDGASSRGVSFEEDETAGIHGGNRRTRRIVRVACHAGQVVVMSIYRRAEYVAAAARISHRLATDILAGVGGVIAGRIYGSVCEATNVAGIFVDRNRRSYMVAGVGRRSDRNRRYCGREDRKLSHDSYLSPLGLSEDFGRVPQAQMLCALPVLQRWRKRCASTCLAISVQGNVACWPPYPISIRKVTLDCGRSWRCFGGATETVELTQGEAAERAYVSCTQPRALERGRGTADDLRVSITRRGARRGPSGAIQPNAFQAALPGRLSAGQNGLTPLGQMLAFSSGDDTIGII